MNTNKKIFIVLCVVTVLALVGYLLMDTSEESETETTSAFAVAPVTHASFGLKFAGLNILNDPVGKEEAYAGFGIPDVIFISDIHADHFDVDTLAAVTGASTTIIAPQDVFTALPAFLQDKTIVMSNGDSHTVGDLSFEVLPMYNLPAENKEILHPKGRGNGYVLEAAGTRIYIAGDTEDIPEMRALQNIQVAFIPMNLPYTMSVETAAEAVLSFAPDVVYPYHYKGADGLADIQEFEKLLAASNSAIQVRILDWYAQ